MTPSLELLNASDEYLAQVVEMADPMVLRGLLYQVTGDEWLRSMAIANDHFGYAFVNRIEHQDDVGLLRTLAVRYLRNCRDEKAAPLGPRNRLLASMSLAAGFELAEDEADIWWEQAAFDPWARGIDDDLIPDPDDPPDFTVGVIGAGLSGLNAAVQLNRAGIDFLVIEKNSEVGGTWWENRYPGARVDSPSRIYSHIFGADFVFPSVFCARDANLEYICWVADRFGIRDNIVFDCEVVSLIWDEAGQFWRVTTRDATGETVRRFNAIISCVGFLSRPNPVPFDGADSFEGTIFHSSRWPDDLNISGKCVAVIGSGASGYQLVPEIAKEAAQVSLFQRTPSWCFENSSYLMDLPTESLWLDRNFPYYVNFSRLRFGSFFGPDQIAESTHIDPGFADPDAVSAINKQMRDICIETLNRKLASRPELIEKMIPDSPPMASRPIMVDDKDSILDALVRDNVSLVSDPIDRISRNGLVAGGQEHLADVVVLAIGFRANDYLWPMEIVGRDGVRLKELWAKDGARAYLGSMLPGFPNFFMGYGPNTNNNGGFQYIDLMEIEIRFALQAIGRLISEKRSAVDVTLDAYWRFNDELDREERKMVYMDPRAHNYWTTGKGRSATNGPIDFRRMWHWLRDPGQKPPEDLDAGIAPYFGHDLFVT